MGRLSFALTLMCAGVPLVLSQRSVDVNLGSRVYRDEPTDRYVLSWWARAGMQYFVQSSGDMLDWAYLPTIVSGKGAVVRMPFETSAEQLFLRLEPVADPFNADRDGDGFSDGYEVLSSLNPNVVDGGGDADGDGVPNGQDARPGDATVGAMAVTIVTPLSGSSLD